MQGGSCGNRSGRVRPAYLLESMITSGGVMWITQRCCIQARVQETVWMVQMRDQSAFLVMLSRMPMLASVQKMDVPPKEMSGRGIPLVGTSESTTLMLKKA